MEWLKGLGFAGFMFFFIKGMMWLVLFALVYFGWVDKEKVLKFKNKLNFFRK